MWGHLGAVLGLAVLCGSWVAFQRWVSRHDPGAPGVEGRCGSCAEPDCEVPDRRH